MTLPLSFLFCSVTISGAHVSTFVQQQAMKCPVTVESGFEIVTFCFCQWKLVQRLSVLESTANVGFVLVFVLSILSIGETENCAV